MTKLMCIDNIKLFDCSLTVAVLDTRRCFPDEVHDLSFSDPGVNSGETGLGTFMSPADNTYLG